MSDLKFKRQRRKVLALTSASVLAPIWVKPVINAVVLPAHAQTSLCVADTVVGGPLAGHPSGAATCQAACESEAESRDAQLCSVIETDTASGTECSCELDTIP